MQGRIHRSIVGWVAAVALLAIGCGPGDDILFTRLPGVVRGTILDGLEPSVPVGQARVSLLGVRSSSSFTRPDGTFELRDVRPGLYDLVADKVIGGASRRVRLRFVEVVDGQVVSLPDLELEVPGSVSGTVLLTGAGPGNPVAPDNAGVEVELIGTTLRALSAADGSWSITPVEQGEYAIRFRRANFEGITVHNVGVTAGANTVVPAVTLARLDPPRTGTLRGRVVLEARPGNDFSGVTVSVLGTTRSLVTTPGGDWWFQDLVVGSYDVGFSHPDYYDDRIDDLLVVSGVPVTVATDKVLSNHKVLDTTVRAGGLALAPSGNQLAYLTDGGNASDIGLLAPEGRVFNQVITTGVRASANRGLEWTQDERNLVFVQFQGSATAAFAPATVTDTGSAPRTLLASGSDYFVSTVSPDNRELLFFLTQNLQAVRLDKDSAGRTIATTSTIRTVAAGLGDVTELNGADWATTGRITYDREVGTGQPDDVFTVLASGNFAPSRLGPIRRPPPHDTGAALQGRFQSPTFSPDASRIAFTLEPGSADPAGIWVVDVDGENAMQITSEPGQYLDWTPDGSRIYYVGLENRHPTVLKVPAFARP